MCVLRSNHLFRHTMLGTHCKNANFGKSPRFWYEKCNRAKLLCIIDNPVQVELGKHGSHTVKDHIIKVRNFKCFKRELKCFLLHHAFYSVAEFMSFWSCGLKVWQLNHLSSLSVIINGGIRAVYCTVFYSCIVIFSLRYDFKPSLTCPVSHMWQCVFNNLNLKLNYSFFFGMYYKGIIYWTGGKSLLLD